MPDDGGCITLREYLESLINNSTHTTTARFAAMDKALEVAVTSLGERFENTNEWRGLVTDQLAKRITREEHDTLVKLVSTCVPREEFASVASRVTNCIERGEHDTTIGRMEQDIRSLRESRAEVEGKASQASVSKVNTLAIAGVIIGVAGVLITMINVLWVHILK